MTRLHAFLGLAGWLVVVFAAAGVGSLYPPGPWYGQLKKPLFTPPAWVFPPVWTLLYLLMAVAAWLVWKKLGIEGGALALGLFILQLILNAAWTWIFFGLQRPGAAFAEIVVLWLAIAATAWSFFGHNRLAGALFLPYLAWVSFAAVLNFELWRLNR